MSQDETTPTASVIYPEIHGFIVELIVPPVLEARAREVMARAPEVKISVDDRMTGDGWLAVTSNGLKLQAKGDINLEFDEDCDILPEDPRG